VYNSSNLHQLNEFGSRRPLPGRDRINGEPGDGAGGERAAGVEEGLGDFSLCCILFTEGAPGECRAHHSTGSLLCGTEVITWQNSAVTLVKDTATSRYILDLEKT